MLVKVKDLTLLLLSLLRLQLLLDLSGAVPYLVILDLSLDHFILFHKSLVLRSNLYLPVSYD